MLSDPFASAFLAQCAHCAGLLDRGASVRCTRCRAAFYCGPACQRAHWRQTDNPELAHSAWCDRLRLYRQRAPALAELPFEFARVTTDERFDSQGLARFLMERGLLGRGMWRRECYAWLGVHPSADADADAYEAGAPLPGDLAPDPEPFALPAEAGILAEPLGQGQPEQQQRTRLSSWADYYQARGLPLDSPVCVLLQWPLTLYHVLFNLLPVDAPDAYKRLLAAPRASRPVMVHLIGAEKEVELIPALCELARLAPGISFRLALIGKEVSPSVDKSVYSELDGRFRVSVYRGLYHQVAAGLLRRPKAASIACGAASADSDAASVGDWDDGDPACPPMPDLVVAFNAGFAASISWPATLEFLQKLSVRTYVTDYCEFSIELSAMVCERLKVGTMTPQRVNPFRSPVRVPNEQLDLPSYSNAFISELVYPS